MNTILDTHTLIWFLNGSDLLSEKIKEKILERETINYVSIVSIWEISIKISLGKLTLNFSLLDLKKELEKNNFQILPITFEDTLVLSNLPFFHRDPFDRLLISQSIQNNFTLLSKDHKFAA